MPRKTEFELDGHAGDCYGKIEIVGSAPRDKPYVFLELWTKLQSGKHVMRTAEIKDRDLERFAVNILKALNSKKLAK